MCVCGWVSAVRAAFFGCAHLPLESKHFSAKGKNKHKDATSIIDRTAKHKGQHQGDARAVRSRRHTRRGCKWFFCKTIMHIPKSALLQGSTDQSNTRRSAEGADSTGERARRIGPGTSAVFVRCRSRFQAVKEASLGKLRKGRKWPGD